MGSVIKKILPNQDQYKQEDINKVKFLTGGNLTDEQATNVLSGPKPPSVTSTETVSATEGPSATEVDMASGMDGIADSLERKKKGRSKTILTGSQGLGDNANTVAPTLLG